MKSLFANISILFSFTLFLGGEVYSQNSEKAFYSPKPPLGEILSPDEAERANRMCNGLKSTLHAYLMNTEDTFKLKGLHLTDGTIVEDLYQIKDNKIVVDFTISKGLQDCLESFKTIESIEVLASSSTPSYSVISALVPVESLMEAMSFPEIGAAHAASTVTRSEGKVSEEKACRSQGLANNFAEYLLNVDHLKDVFPWADGGGIKVGVISNSVDNYAGGISDSQASGDLPSNDHILVIQDWTGSASSDEGRALMEHVYDIAPSVETFGFATAIGGQAVYANNIAALSDAEMDIITDDIRPFDEPIFQNGVIAQAIATFVNGGGIYFSAAGNDADNSLEDVFTDSNGNGFHEYEPPTETIIFAEYATIRFPANDPPSHTHLILQWTQPWGAATTNFDLEVYAVYDPPTLLHSSTTNNIGGNPHELISVPTEGISRDHWVAIKWIEGPVEGVTLKLTVINGEILDYPEKAGGTIDPHAGIPENFAIGAAPWYRPNTAERFSSHGPYTRYFDAAGNPVGPYTFAKPDFMSIDACNTTFFGRDIPEDADDYPNFYGTSASAPNAAGVAALLLDLAGGPGSLNKEDMKEALAISAIDTGEEGHDKIHGYGSIHALGAGVVAKGPGTIESSLYLNQNGDVYSAFVLSSNQDLDIFEYASNRSGSTTIDVYESHDEMDPMMVLFSQILDRPTAVAYDGGVGDDVQLTFDGHALFPYTMEILSEELFNTQATYNVIVDAPFQELTTRTSYLNSAHDDVNFSGSLVAFGDSDYMTYISPVYGTCRISLQPSGFNAFIRVYDIQGDLIGSGLVANGGQGSITVHNLGLTYYYIQVVSWAYSGYGSYVMSVDFDGLTQEDLSSWLRPNHYLCGIEAPNILQFLDLISYGECFGKKEGSDQAN